MADRWRISLLLFHFQCSVSNIPYLHLYSFMLFAFFDSVCLSLSERGGGWGLSSFLCVLTVYLLLSVSVIISVYFCYFSLPLLFNFFPRRITFCSNGSQFPQLKQYNLRPSTNTINFSSLTWIVLGVSSKVGGFIWISILKDWYCQFWFSVTEAWRNMIFSKIYCHCLHQPCCINLRQALCYLRFGRSLLYELEGEN